MLCQQYITKVLLCFTHLLGVEEAPLRGLVLGVFVRLSTVLHFLPGEGVISGVFFGGLCSGAMDTNLH